MASRRKKIINWNSSCIFCAQTIYKYT